MLTGKAAQRAFRGLLLVDSALSATIVSDEFNVKAPCIAPAQDITEMEAESSTALLDEIVHEAETTRPCWDNTDRPWSSWKSARRSFDCESDRWKSVHITRANENIINWKARCQKQFIQASRTAKLWLQFVKMMDIFRMFLKGERMGIWELHIQAMYYMMPYLAASGYNLYTNCIHVYLQQMHKLHETHPEVSKHFDQGLHVVRRSDRLWAGLYLILSLSKSSCWA